MPFAMLKLAFVLACLAYVSSGRRLQASTMRMQNSPSADGNAVGNITLDSLQSFARLLLGDGQASAFHPTNTGVHIPRASAAVVKSAQNLQTVTPSGSRPASTVGMQDGGASQFQQGGWESSKGRIFEAAPVVMGVTQADPRITELVFSTLATQPGFLDEEGVDLDALCELIENDQLLAKDEDYERIYDSCDKLEEEGLIRVENDDEGNSVLYLAETKAEDFQFFPEEVRPGILNAFMKKQRVFGSGEDAIEDAEEEIVEIIEEEVPDDYYEEIELPPLPERAPNVVIEDLRNRKAQLESLNATDVLFDARRHLEYDYDAELDMESGVVSFVSKMKRAGFDKDDEKWRDQLQEACQDLEEVTKKSPAPPLRQDPRLVGDWQVYGHTSDALAKRQGLTGLGAAPFSAIETVFLRFLPSGEVIAKEIVQFFGNPVVVNELRGKFAFTEDSLFMQEQYTEGDMSGERNSKGFTGATATSTPVCITTDGAMRLTKLQDGGYCVYKKLKEGMMESYLEERRLPIYGGTTMEMDMNSPETAKAYPYLKDKKEMEKKGMFGNFPNPFR